MKKKSVVLTVLALLAIAVFADPLNRDDSCTWAKQAEGGFTGKYNLFFEFSFDEDLQSAWDSTKKFSTLTIPIEGSEPFTIVKVSTGSKLGLLKITEDYVYEDSPLYGTQYEWDIVYLYMPAYKDESISTNETIICTTVSFSTEDETYYSLPSENAKGAAALFDSYEGSWIVSFGKDQNNDEYLKLEGGNGDNKIIYNYLWLQD